MCFCSYQDIVLHADAIHRGAGQISPTAKRVFAACQMKVCCLYIYFLIKHFFSAAFFLKWHSAHIKACTTWFCVWLLCMFYSPVPVCWSRCISAILLCRWTKYRVSTQHCRLVVVESAPKPRMVVVATCSTLRRFCLCWSRLDSLSCYVRTQPGRCSVRLCTMCDLPAVIAFG